MRGTYGIKILKFLLIVKQILLTIRNINKDNIKMGNSALFTFMTKTFAFTLPFYFCLLLVV